MIAIYLWTEKQYKYFLTYEMQLSNTLYHLNAFLQQMQIHLLY